ncbi:hypothetical protein ACLQ2S_15525 [Micromonospora sp. DT48]|uniref:hypothetical protein n=1 Tax=unclassified Micromonospora TaxID=2617518 RepID=UPI0012BC4BBD|nr:hypothetical protein [Micromonospora sp. CP22]MTK04220.1 hypothetical protein [Micromonospora sp. CP22]
MSGSPKYTTVDFDAARRAELAAARRRRQEERRRRQEEQRQQRFDAAVRAAETRRDALTERLRQLTDSSRGLSQHAQVTAESGRVAGLGRPSDGAELSRLGRELRSAERRVDKLTAEVSRELTRVEHGRAVELAVAPVRSLTDAEQLDPVGHRNIGALLGEARRLAGDPRGFADLHRRLGEAVGAHVETVRDRQASLMRLATESDELAAQLSTVLADAAAAGVTVDGAAELRAAVAGLRRTATGNTDYWERQVAGLRERIKQVAVATDARLDQLDRMALIVEAASAALPAAGLRVVPDSLTERADAVVFLAERADGSAVELTVHAGDGSGNRLEYRTDGSDTVVERTVDGQSSRCDLTEELLERFHTELAGQGVEADGLHWEGKPAIPRPPARQALTRPAQDDRSRS